MTGRNDYLPLMADSESEPAFVDRALDLVHSTEAKRLPRASQIELRIVESGIAATRAWPTPPCLPFRSPS